MGTGWERGQGRTTERQQQQSHPAQRPFDQKWVDDEQVTFIVVRLAQLCFCWLFSSNLTKRKTTS